MSKKTYHKDIRQSFSNSKGRVISIASLMALGSFALVGLKVASPDIQKTGENFFKDHHAADVTLIGTYGISESEEALLNSLSSEATIDYGYLKDVVIEGSDEAIRIFSNSDQVSTYDLVSGSLPSQEGQIALSDAYSNRYKIGDTISFSEKESINGKMVLKDHSFTITGFVNSSEIISRVNLGQSTAGSGELKGYAVVDKSSFDSEVYMIARLAYKDLSDLSPYSQAYLDSVYQRKQEAQALFNEEPAQRLAAIKADYQSQIDEGHQKIQEAEDKLKDAANQLADGQNQINDGQNQLEEAKSQVQEGQDQLDDAADQLADGRTKLANSQQALSQGREQLDAGADQLADKKAQLDSAGQQLANGSSQLASAKDQLDQAATTIAQKEKEFASAKAQLEAGQAQLEQAQAQLDQAKAQLDSKQTALNQGKAQLEQAKTQLQEKSQELAQAQAKAKALPEGDQKTALLAQLAQEEAKLQAGQAQLQAKEKELSTQEGQLQAAWGQYESQKAQLDSKAEELRQKTGQYEAGLSQLAAAKEKLAQGQAAYDQNQETFQDKEAQYQAGLAAYRAGQRQLNEKEATYKDGLRQYQEGLALLQEKEAEYQEGIAKIEEAQATIAQKEEELEEAKATLAQKTAEYEEAKAKADPEIADKKKELQEAQEKVDDLETPIYNFYTRREIPGYEGYVSYENNASIISNVGNIFPVVLYFIAALVTFVTMSRFVEEERIKAGTFKALGYDDRDIIKKFVTYGLITSMVGTIVGITAGHLLLPKIIYETYSTKLVVAPLEYHFYPLISLIAVLVSLLAAVLPAYMVSKKELAEKPAQLLLPKPPKAGDKILLERITPLWKKMSFTHKVTARNIFRYKQRMFMTIFGVCGSIALLFAGLGVRSSIADLNNRQFVDIIKYDMIIANKDKTDSQEEAEINRLLNSSEVKSHLSLHYETVTKVAGPQNDEQDITTLVLNDADLAKFNDYISLRNRQTGQALNLDQDGVVISEKMADLANIKVGDTITVYNSQKEAIDLPVTGITEMYMSHFLFMNQETYQKAFGKVATDNANMVILQANDKDKTSRVAAQFMALNGVKGVVQNTTLKAQVETIVDSLNRVMGVMIATSVMLAVVVLYNLTNVNVSERIRELSTIKVLGFYDKEVTLYIYRETICLSLVGILVGFGLGLALHAYMVAIIPPASVMFNPAVGWLIYAVPAGVVILILIVLGVVVNHWLKKVDMLEALKSVE